MKRVVVVMLAGAALAFSGVLASACSSSEEEAAPSRPVIPVAETSTSSDAGQDAEAGPVDPGCSGAAGCYKCEPKTSEEILNSCTDGQCTPFDNVARLPLFKAGQALPPVP